MKLKTTILICSSLFASCIGLGGTKAKSATKVIPIEPTYYTYNVVNTYPHKEDSYTQGLIFHNGELIEGTGLNGSSRIMKVDLESGKTKLIASLSSQHFGEGITLLGDTLYQLTWTSNRLFTYDINSGAQIGERVYTGQGWGITTDGQRLYTSDGSSIISIRRPSDFVVERRIAVTINGESINYLNELEWIDGKIWANVYTTNSIIIINPENGITEGIIDLSGILAPELITPTTDVLNGIAYDKEGKRIFVTGKNWSQLFEIEIIER